MPPKRDAVRSRARRVEPVEADAPVIHDNPRDPAAGSSTDGTAKRKRPTPAPAPAQKKESTPDDAEPTTTTGPTAPSKPAKKPRVAKPDPFHADALARHPPRIGTTTQVPMRHLIGAHTSTSGGPEYALVNAGELGANALAMFLKNQRRWESKPFEPASVGCWERMMRTREDGGAFEVCNVRVRDPF